MDTICDTILLIDIPTRSETAKPIPQLRRHVLRSYLVMIFLGYVVAAIGCADLEEIPDTDIRRTDSTAVVKCKTTQETWHLICRDNKWIGDLKTCTVEITDGDSLIYPSIGN